MVSWQNKMKTILSILYTSIYVCLHISQYLNVITSEHNKVVIIIDIIKTIPVIGYRFVLT